ncbi:MAG: hypothetical protein JPMHGGIA_02028 [Saprospiraceae bacterium]|nr:hypothetical protein [Saprospiraceae bacterium]
MVGSPYGQFFVDQDVFCVGTGGDIKRMPVKRFGIVNGILDGAEKFSRIGVCNQITTRTSVAGVRLWLEACSNQVVIDTRGKEQFIIYGTGHQRRD